MISRLLRRDAAGTGVISAVSAGSLHISCPVHIARKAVNIFARVVPAIDAKWQRHTGFGNIILNISRRGQANGAHRWTD